MIAIDTNVFVYAIDVAEPVKQAKARDLLNQLSRSSSPVVLLWQVAAEYLSVLRRWEQSHRISSTDVKTYMQQLLSSTPLVLPLASVVDESIQLSRAHSLSHWDSMLLAACIVAGVDTLYSEDLTDGATYDTVKVANPFV